MSAFKQYGDNRMAVIQALTNGSELSRLLTFLRAVCHDPLLNESWVSLETVYTAVLDRRQRAAKVLQEYIEPVKSSTESPGFHLSLDLATSKGQKALVYEERDTRSSQDVLVRRRLSTPVDQDTENFLEFQSCIKKHQIIRKGIRVQFTESVVVTLFTVEQSDCPLGPEDILMEIESPVKEGSAPDSIEAVREAAGVLQE